MDGAKRLNLLSVIGYIVIFGSSLSMFSITARGPAKTNITLVFVYLKSADPCENTNLHLAHHIRKRRIFPTKFLFRHMRRFCTFYCSLKVISPVSLSIASTIASDSSGYPRLRMILPPDWNPFSITIPIPSTVAPASVTS